MTITVDTDDTIFSLVENITSRQSDTNGYAVDPTDGSACAVSVDSGLLGATDTLSVGSGTVTYNGVSTSVASQSVSLRQGGSNPRWDVVYVDANGAAHVSEGTGAPKAPADADIREVSSPTPPSFVNTEAVVLAMFYVDANTTQITTSSRVDLRVYGTFGSGGGGVSQSTFDSHTADASAHHTRYSDAEAQTAINNDPDHGTNASHNYFSGSHGDLSNVGAADHHQPYTDEMAQDATAALLTEGNNISLTYDDANNALTIDASGTATSRTDEEIEDVAAALLTEGNNISLTYDDANDALTIDATYDGTITTDVDNTTTTTDTLHSTYNDTTGERDIRDYGADDTGSTTSDTALSDAIAAADPHDTIVLKDGTYQLTGNHVINKPLTIKGVNAEITRPTTNTAPLIRFQGGGPTGTSADITTAVNKGESVINVSDASLFTAGDDVMVTDGSATRDAEVPFDFGSVISTDTTNNTITIDTATTYDYANATDGAGKVAIIDLMESPRLVDLDCNGNSDTAAWFLIEWARDPLYDNVNITHHLEEAMYAFASWRPTWNNCSARWANDRTSGNGEPFKASKCQGARFLNPYVSECRRGVDLVRYSHDNYVQNPVIKKFTIGGVITHGTPATNTTVVGGTLTGDPSVSGGTAIYNAGGYWTVRGTTILASGEGIAPNGNFTATDVEIQPIASGAEYAVSVVDSDDIHVEGRINDPNGWFDSSANSTVVQVYALNNDVHNVTLDLDATIGVQTGVRVISETGNVVENLKLTGRLDKQGTDGYGFRLDGSVRNFDASMDMFNLTNNGYLLYNGEFIEGFRLHDARVEAGSNPAVFVGSNHSATNRIWVNNCDLTGSYSVRIMRTDASDVHVWGNRLNGTTQVESTESSVTFEQGDGSQLEADMVDGYDIQKNGTDGTGVINFKT